MSITTEILFSLRCGCNRFDNHGNITLSEQELKDLLLEVEYNFSKECSDCFCGSEEEVDEDDED